VNQVGEQGDRAGEREDHHLGARGQAEQGQTDRDRADARPGADDRGVDQAVRVAVVVFGRMSGALAQETSSIRSG
jgi:hypothetical protein